MTRAFLFLILVLAGPASILGQADTASGPVHAQIRAVIDEYEAKVRANTQKIIAATTEAEKARYRGTIPSAGPYATQVLALVVAHPEDPGSVTGVSWLITQAAAFPESEKALELLAERYSGSAGIAPAVKSLEFRPLEKVEPVLQAIRQKNPHAEERAAALHALGMQYFRRADAALSPPEAEAARTKAMDCFQEIIASHGEVKIQGFPIADQAGRMLFEMGNLSVGSQAPEIAGQDLDGQAFSLSDYRGQHVLLVFWGGWCHACHGVLPQINQFATEMKTQGKPVVVLGINTDIPAEARKAVQDYQVNFRNWADGTTSGPITTLFNLRNFPTFYFVGPDGKILLKQTGLDAVKERVKGL